MQTTENIGGIDMKWECPKCKFVWEDRFGGLNGDESNVPCVYCITESWLEEESK